jgi:hypothetical protein
LKNRSEVSSLRVERNLDAHSRLAPGLFDRTTEPYFLSEKVDVDILDNTAGSVVIGRGSASCVYADHRA